MKLHLVYLVRNEYNPSEKIIYLIPTLYLREVSKFTSAE